MALATGPGSPQETGRHSGASSVQWRPETQWRTAWPTRRCPGEQLYVARLPSEVSLTFSQPCAGAGGVWHSAGAQEGAVPFQLPSSRQSSVACAVSS